MYGSMDLKDDPDMAAAAQLALGLAGGGSVWPQAPPPVSAPQAHTATGVPTQHVPSAPPPAHNHPTPANQKPPDSFIDKGLLEAAAFMDGKPMSLPLKTGESVAGGDNSSLPWAIQNTLLQQYGQFMLDSMLKKQSEGGTTATATATTDSLPGTHHPVSAAAGPSNQSKAEGGGATAGVGGAGENSDPIEAQRDVYRRMLNYSSALTQQYYLSQYGYNYMQDRSLFKQEPGQTSVPASSTAAGSSPGVSQPVPGRPNQPPVGRAQLPSIDSVLLNLSTKKTNNNHNSPGQQGTSSQHETSMAGTQHATTAHSHTIPAYGLQALANAAIEADPKAFSEAESERKDGQKSELEDITDTDDSNMSPSDGSTVLSPSRNTFPGHTDTHISIPAAHSHQYQSVYQSKAPMAPLPSIHHFSAIGKGPQQKMGDSLSSIQLPVSTGIKPSDLVAAAIKLKVEPSEEKEIADRTIQEQIAAHQRNAVHQQVQDLTAGALAAGNLDAAALLAKLPLGTSLESELHRHMERVYDYDPDTLQSSLQQEPMELTAEGSPGKANSRRKSRGRPTSIESLRDPLGRQYSTTSSQGGATSMSGDGEDRTYDCEICGKQFSHNDRLRRHRKIHTTEKPYKCDICGKGFKEKCNLKHHRFIHTGEKPYKCDTCGKAFNQRSSLKTHQKVHTGEKPFKCDLCEKPFAQKYLLRQHMKKHIEANLTSQPLELGTISQQ